ncbi:hypothetical protein [Variovorax sp. N23]|uniref:hypothetical protein n=1 Tax=Variovorax sp. N23 TaxID=2980555 RepID=UPI0021CA8CB6|nr:hypothetical protein [Variovorax sp. N23]MCU4120942.1 hypothetical protein [Variovorax sp. N23]
MVKAMQCRLPQGFHLFAFKKQEQAKGDARFDLAFASAKAVKSTLRDPDSLKWEFIGVNDDATVACLKYRAKNGFGGMNGEFAVIANGKATRSAADWKKHCSAPLHEETVAGG